GGLGLARREQRNRMWGADETTPDASSETVGQSPEATPQRERPWLMNLSIACADVGSEAKDNFGWASCDVSEAVEEVPLREADYALVSRAQTVWRLQFRLVEEFTL